jgi:hypothetical protein
MSELQKKISEITAEIGAIKKKKEQNGPTYAFRSIDDVMNKLSPLMASKGVTITSKVLDRKLEKRTAMKWDNYRKENVEKFYFFAEVTLAVTFHYGEESETWEEWAMSEDSSDKAPTQAMSMAYKYAILRKFCILTEDISKSDSDKKPTEEAPTPPPAPVVKEELTKSHASYKKVLDALIQKTATIEQVKTKFEVSTEMEAELAVLVQKADAARIGGKK